MSERCQHADTVAAYLLGALVGAERTQFEAHLAGCAQCRDDVAALRVVTQALPLAVEPVAPPPQLRERLMETVRAEADLLHATGPAADRPRPVPKRRTQRWFGRPFAIAGAAAALVVGVGVGFGLGSATDDEPETRTVVQVRTVQAEVDPATAPRGAAFIVMRNGVATLRVRGLPQPPRGYVYEVWLLRRGAAAPSPTDALFGVSRTDGSGRIALPSVRGVEAVLVTAEPAGGSPAPTSQPFINASL
jgi:anti-sigma-K factor RskA